MCVREIKSMWLMKTQHNFKVWSNKYTTYVPEDAWRLLVKMMLYICVLYVGLDDFFFATPMAESLELKKHREGVCFINMCVCICVCVCMCVCVWVRNRGSYIFPLAVVWYPYLNGDTTDTFTQILMPPLFSSSSWFLSSFFSSSFLSKDLTRFFFTCRKSRTW